MKKKIIAIIGLFLVIRNKIIAQQWAMDEVYDDWRDTRSDSPSFGYGLLGLIMLAAAIFVIWLIVQLIKKHKEGIKDFFEDSPGCGCMIIGFGILIFLTLIGVVK